MDEYVNSVPLPYIDWAISIKSIIIIALKKDSL